MLKRVVNYILDIIYPRRCVCCDSVYNFGDAQGICGNCKQKLIYVTTKSDNQFFNKRNIWVNENYAVLLYDEEVKNLIFKLKYKDRPKIAEIISEYMQEKFEEIILDKKIDLVMSVPIHKKRLRERGYNQATLIMNELAKKIDVETDENYIKRIKNTIPQNGLSVKKRAQNLHDAFEISKKNKKNSKTYKNILIIDDIYTTGSTVENCAELLKREGTANVYSFCLALAVK